MSYLIEAANISKSFGDIDAVVDLSLGIRKGETFGLLGPNGAGKSTTIAMLMGLLSPDSGQILIDGQHANDVQVRRRIGLAPQSLSLYTELSALENLRFFGGLYGLSGAELNERVEQMLQLAQLEDRRHDRVSHYSGGMKRRLNIAVAMIHQPEILLLDEPTVGVDPQSRNHILDSIRKLASEGLTVLYTTHYMEEAEKLCDRIGIVDHGRLLAIGTKEELYHQHTNGCMVRFQSAMAQSVGQLVGVSDLEVNQNEVSFASKSPVAVLSQLAQASIEVENLMVQQPGLESVFLTLTGRTLRD